MQTITFVHINWDRCKGINGNNSTDLTTLLKYYRTAPPTMPSILEKGKVVIFWSAVVSVGIMKLSYGCQEYLLEEDLLSLEELISILTPNDL